MKKSVYILRFILIISFLFMTGLRVLAFDGASPVFTNCPGTIYLPVCNPLTDYIATASGSPEPTYSFVFTGATLLSDTGTGTGRVLNQGTTTITITAINSVGSAQCIFDIIVDTLPPIFTYCPSDFTVNGNPANCGAIVDYQVPVAYVPCPIVTPDQIPGFYYAGAFNGHKYYYTFTTYSYPEAEAIAAQSGGYLVTITSPEENAFIYNIAHSYMDDNVWLGCTDEGTEGNWRWKNGEAFTYSNWENYEPNNWENVEHWGCMYFNTGRWNDYPEYNYLCVIIEFNASVVTLVSGLSPGSFFPNGTTANTYEITDRYGQKATCSFNVTVIDTLPPTIICPGDQTIHCSNSNYIIPGGLDNCSTTGIIYMKNSCTYEPFNMDTAVYLGSCDDCLHDITLPFTFKYFDIERTKIYIGSNGFITFDHEPPIGTGCCNGLSLPNADFGHSIAVAWMDLNSSMHYKTFGSAPNRVFVINWTGNEYGTSEEVKVQLALYENTNEIRIISINNADIHHTKTMGLNLDSTTAVTVPGRNSSIWEATNECLSFTPVQPATLISGIPSGSEFPTGITSVSYALFDESGNSSDTCTFNITYEPYMSGYVTVGTGGNYPNLTGAGGLFESVNSNGICGILYAQIISDIEEPGTFSLNEIMYADFSDSHLYITTDQPDYRYIYGNVNQSLIRLNGSDHVWIDGSMNHNYNDQFLVFENLNPAQAALELTNDASFNTIEYCTFKGVNSNASSGVVVLGQSSMTMGNSYNTFTFNRFCNSSGSGIYPANLFYSSGSESALNTENLIQNNGFFNFDQKGINVTSTGNGPYWEIINNYFNFTDTPVTKANKTFIHFTPGNSSQNNSIENNRIDGNGSPIVFSGPGYIKGIVALSTINFVGYNYIGNIKLTCSGITNFTGVEIPDGYTSVYDNNIGYDLDHPIITAGTGTITGILAGSPTAVNIFRNEVRGFIFTKTTGSPVFKGIQIKNGFVGQNLITDITSTQINLSPTFYGIANTGSGLTEPNKISNNMISINSGVSQKPRVYGLFDQSVGIGANFYLNSVYIYGNTTNGYFTSAFYRIGNATTVLYNNILVNDRVANVYGKHYAIHTNTQLNWTSNYNVLYTVSGCLGNWGGATYANLTSWRLMTGQDINSIFYKPVFLSVDDLHLDPFENGILSGAGGHKYTYSYDFDYDTRSYYPTPGADELNGSGGGDRIEPEAQVENDVESNSMTVYPNPVISSSTISINLTQDNIISIDLYNMIGEKIMVIANGNYAAGNYNFNIDAGNIPAGAYMCRYMVNGGESIMKRVEIVK